MFSFISIAALALSAVASVHGAAIPRTNVPSTYDAAVLEPYSQYNTRYMALDCEDKHNTQFFTDCCHPMKSNETLAKNRLPYCNPATASLSSSAALPTETDNSDDECDDDDEPSSSVAPSVTATPTVVPSAVTTSHVSSSAPSPVKPSSVKASSTPVAPVNVAPAPSKAAPTPSPSPSQAATGIDSLIHTGHSATWFYQHDTAGACGNVHADTDKVVALDSALYGNLGAVSQYCGKSLVITNTNTGKSVTAIVADACPTCDAAGSIDLSQGAFEALDTLEDGQFDVSWHFTN
ncbi:hypothetical protein EW026_g5871 [Hermanssonia centrifuga]|uniref:RlpA-like protein double-psi beta-barrel domain-containing protein n=1 Tax=Hermanssonia centrifuga TaxID=98765 RepID=A0A4V6S0W2_9APHY|nr:hypothetical protein EW026_g5871 [Hermanssonia centrifuga]